MLQTSARAVALAALRTWRRQQAFADSIIARLFERKALPPSDRAFAIELFYGVLRNLTLLDFWISELRSGRVDGDVRDLLRLGLYQLFLAKVSEHAAVNETVGLITKNKRGIVNAILRSATRRRNELEKRAKAQPLDVRTSHPKFLIERWQKAFSQDAAEALCDWNNRPPPIYARINQLEISPRDFVRTYSGSSLLPNLENFAELENGFSKAIAAGHCYIQDPSTAIACELLQPKRGEKILDACAAPGGKTSYLAELMQNRGLLVACDRDPERLRLLKQNLVRLGIRIAKTVRHDWTRTKIPDEIASEAPFDRILLDAPCSNTGVMRRRVDVRWRLTPADFARMQKCQIQIARAVLPLLKPGGIFVYSTCSLEREENKEVTPYLEISNSQLEEERFSLPFRDHFDGAFAARFRNAK